MTLEEFKKAIKEALWVFVKFEMSDNQDAYIQVTKTNLRAILKRKDFSEDKIFAAKVGDRLFIG
jgi:hypothetical protein